MNRKQTISILTTCFTIINVVTLKQSQQELHWNEKKRRRFY